MKQSAIIYLLIFATLYVQVNSRLRARMTSFKKELTFQNKRIILSASNAVVTDQDSFVYAVCDSEQKTFKENNCNITVETPLFTNATYKDMCIVHLVPNNRKLDSLTKLQLYPLSDDKVLLSWLVKNDDYGTTKMANVRIIRMSNCKINDIVLPAEKIHKIVTHDNSFDVILNNKTFCGSENCKLSYDLEGKKISGPTQFLSEIKFPHLSTAVSPVPPSPIVGYYVIVWSNAHSFQIIHVGANGKGTELAKVDNSLTARISNAYDVFSSCWATERTNITCKQFDSKMKTKLNIVLGFLDDPGFGTARWFQPHNLHEGGLLLVTGQVSGKDNRKFEKFRIIKINADGFRNRPLEVDDLNFECANIDQFFVNVSENDEDEVCFHFICDRGDYDDKGIRNTLKFSTKCLPKVYMSMTKRKASILN